MNNETKPDFWPIINAVDDCGAELERVRNLLCLYEEHLEREMESLDEEKPWSITCIKNRYPMLKSLLESITAQVCDAITSLSDAADNGAEICREIRQQTNNE